MNNVRFLFSATVHGTGSKVISSEPKIRTQGNGNFTGFIRKTYDDGAVTDATFIENAASIEAVRAAFNRASH